MIIIKLVTIKKITSHDMKLGHKLTDPDYTTVPCYCHLYSRINEFLVEYFPIEKHNFYSLHFHFDLQHTYKSQTS